MELVAIAAVIRIGLRALGRRLGRFFHAWQRAAEQNIVDGFWLAGGSALAAGFWDVSPAHGKVALGIFCVVSAIVLAHRGQDTRR